MDQAIEMRVVPVKELKPSPYNPRQNLRPGDEDYESLAKSVDTFGYVEPIVWNERSGNIVGGHQRLTVLKERGVAEIEVSVVDLDELNEQMLCLALNRVGGRWDREQLQKMIVDMVEKGVDMSATGFSELQVQKMLEAEQNIIDEPLYDLGLEPLEYYDFIMVVFRDARDWLVACNKLGVTKVRCSRRHDQVGLGRSIDGTTLLEQLK